MSRLAFPPDRWLPHQSLREAAEWARARFAEAHPFRRKPADPEAELRAIAWELEPLATPEQVTLVVSDTLELTRGHFPKPAELRQAVRKHAPEAPRRHRGDAPVDPDRVEPWMRERMALMEARADAVLRGAGFDAAALPPANAGTLIGRHLTELLELHTRRLRKRYGAEAVRAFWADWADGAGLTLDQLTDGTRVLVERAQAVAA